MLLKMLLQSSFPAISVAFVDMVGEIGVPFGALVAPLTLVAEVGIRLAIFNSSEEKLPDILATEFHASFLLK